MYASAPARRHASIMSSSLYEEMTTTDVLWPASERTRGTTCSPVASCIIKSRRTRSKRSLASRASASFGVDADSTSYAISLHELATSKSACTRKSANEVSIPIKPLRAPSSRVRTRKNLICKSSSTMSTRIRSGTPWELVGELEPDMLRESNGSGRLDEG